MRQTHLNCHTSLHKLLELNTEVGNVERRRPVGRNKIKYLKVGFGQGRNKGEFFHQQI